MVGRLIQLRHEAKLIRVGHTAPTTWSELANPELVDNVSNRERTRQEIL